MLCLAHDEFYTPLLPNRTRPRLQLPRRLLLACRAVLMSCPAYRIRRRGAAAVACLLTLPDVKLGDGEMFRAYHTPCLLAVSVVGVDLT